MQFWVSQFTGCDQRKTVVLQHAALVGLQNHHHFLNDYIEHKERKDWYRNHSCLRLIIAGRNFTAEGILMQMWSRVWQFHTLNMLRYINNALFRTREKFMCSLQWRHSMTSLEKSAASWFMVLFLMIKAQITSIDRNPVTQDNAQNYFLSISRRRSKRASTRGWQAS